jgi:hypothetical protein
MPGRYRSVMPFVEPLPPEPDPSAPVPTGRVPPAWDRPSLTDDGYTVVRGVLDAACVERTRLLVHDLLEERPAYACERENNLLAGLRFDDLLVDDLLSNHSYVDASAPRRGAAQLRTLLA